MSNIYMKAPNITGNVTTNPYQGWIALNSADFDVTRNIRMQVGNITDRENTIPSFSELEIAKQLDTASNGLFQSACNATNLAQVEIHVCSTGKEITPYAKYTLSNVIISHYSSTINKVGLPGETLKLNFTQLESSYIPRGATGQAQSPNTVGYNLETAETC